MVAERSVAEYFYIVHTVRRHGMGSAEGTAVEEKPKVPYPSVASGMAVSLVLDERGAVACVGTPEEGGKGGCP